MLHTRNRLTGIALLTAVGLALTACGSGSGQAGEEDFPNRELTMIAAGGPGGGLDTASRQLVEGMQSAGVEEKITVANDGGGNGNSARATLLNRPNDGYSVVVESNRIILNPMMGTTDLEFDQFTPLAQLTTDVLVWAVPADSEYADAQQIIDAVKADPKSVIFGVGTTPSNDQLNILLPMQEAGVENVRELNIVNFLDGGSLNTELLGGRVNVASTGLSEAGPLVESGDIRILAISGEEPMDGAAEGVPTWSELGLDVVVEHWRGVFGPADMPEEAVEWWTSTIEEATKTQEWETAVANVGLTSEFLAGDAFKEQVEEQEGVMEEVFTEIGVIDGN